MVSFETKDFKLSYIKINYQTALSLKSHVKGELFPLSLSPIGLPVSSIYNLPQSHCISYSVPFRLAWGILSLTCTRVFLSGFDECPTMT